MNSHHLTVGEAMILVNARTVAMMRGWDMEKTIAKLRHVADELDKAVKEAEAEPTHKAPAPPPAPTDKTVQTFEKLLRDIQQSDQEDPPTAR